MQWGTSPSPAVLSSVTLAFQERKRTKILYLSFFFSRLRVEGGNKGGEEEGKDDMV